MRRFRTFMLSPPTRFFVAVGMVFTALFELGDTVIEDFLGIEIGVHYGVMVFGFFEACRAILEGLENADRVQTHLERVERRRDEGAEGAKPPS